MLRIVRRMGLGILLFILVLGLGITMFVSFAPQFGKSPSGADLERIKKSPNYGKSEFVNLIETKMDLPISKMPGLLWGFLNPPKGKNPETPLPTNWMEGEQTLSDSLAYVTWYGHSAILLEIDQKKILIDPMLGNHSSPVSFMTQRFTYKESIPIERLDYIDAIIISHDHYDHLDYPSILKLKEKTGHFYTALGVGSHLKYWGVPEDKITELDWWQAANCSGVKLIAAPARHFSGRGVLDRNKTQWASWIIEGINQKIYFSGDGGYGPHFKEIGEKFGPFDFAMLECGQYNQMWEAIHMMPEQSVQAALDVRGKISMPIHWGAFDLAPHKWTDPAERFSAKAKEVGLNYVTPIIGQRFAIGTSLNTGAWWREL